MREDTTETMVKAARILDAISSTTRSTGISMDATSIVLQKRNKLGASLRKFDKLDVSMTNVRGLRGDDGTGQ